LGHVFGLRADLVPGDPGAEQYAYGGDGQDAKNAVFHGLVAPSFLMAPYISRLPPGVKKCGVKKSRAVKPGLR
jgi:hypothetical protein